MARFEVPPVIDGVIDEPAWRVATELGSFVETWPGDNAAPRLATRAWVGVDDENFYFAVVAEDAAGAVRATLGRRDHILADDHVRILLDTFDDRRRAYVLVLNPFGIAQDGIWVEGDDVDYSFDLLFSSKGTVGPDGYTIELAVPFASLRARVDAQSAWGLHVFRRIRHLDDAEISWRPIERGRARVLEQSGRLTGFVAPRAGQRLEAIPTWTAARSVEPDTDEKQEEERLGGTVRWTLGQAAVVDAAIRPDFAQVESDQPVVTANQRFPLFFAEKRPFFLEGAELFRTPLSLVDTRTVLDPELAIKATARRGGTTLGAFVARDNRSINTADRRSIEMADLGVLRWLRQGARGELGTVVTGSNAFERRNVVVGVDGRWNPDTATAIAWQVVGSEARRRFYDPDLDLSVLRDGSGASYFVEGVRNGRRRTFTLRGEGRSPDYVADLGYTRQVDLQRWSVTARYDAEPRVAELAQSRIAVQSWSAESVVLAQTDWSGHPTYAYLYPQLHLRFARQTAVSLFGYLDFLEIREHEFGPRRSPQRAGAFFGEPFRRSVYRGLSLQVSTTPNEQLTLALLVDRSWNQLDFDFGGGPGFPAGVARRAGAPGRPRGAAGSGSGHEHVWSATVDWRPTTALRLALDFSRSTLKRYDTDLMAHDQRLLTLRATYQFSRAIFARLRTSYDSLAGTSLSEALLAWEAGTGNRDLPGLRGAGDSRRPSAIARAIRSSAGNRCDARRFSNCRIAGVGICRSEGDERRPPAPGVTRCVAEREDPRVPGQQGAYALALHADAAAVNQAQFDAPLRHRFVEPSGDDLGHVARREAVQIEHVGELEGELAPLVEIAVVVHWNNFRNTMYTTKPSSGPSTGTPTSRLTIVCQGPRNAPCTPTPASNSRSRPENSSVAQAASTMPSRRKTWPISKP